MSPLSPGHPISVLLVVRRRQQAGSQLPAVGWALADEFLQVNQVPLHQPDSQNILLSAKVWASLGPFLVGWGWGWGWGGSPMSHGDFFFNTMPHLIIMLSFMCHLCLLTLVPIFCVSTSYHMLSIIKLGHHEKSKFRVISPGPQSL